MNTISVLEATKLYKVQKNAVICQTPINHQYFREFSYQLSKLIHSVQDLMDDEFWVQSLKVLKRYRFDMSVAPVGFGNPDVISPEILKRVEYAAEDCRSYYPDYSLRFEKLIESLKDLVEKNENPFLDEIKKLLLKKPSQIALLLKQTRHIPIVEKILIENEIENSLVIVSESQLRKPDITFPRIVCFGASRWFSDYIFRAPRAEEIVVMRFSWIKDSDCRANSVFSGSNNVRQVLRKRNPTLSKTPLAENSFGKTTVEVQLNDGWIEDEELIPSIDLSNVSQKFSIESTSQPEETDKITAKLFQLEGGRGVFLETEGNSTTLVIDLDEDVRKRVYRAITNHIQAGIFMLQRTDEGEGNDYIIPIADKILGNRAKKLREFQKKWKKSLKSLVNSLGIEKVIYFLKKEGAIRASETNIRNWMSERSIRTADHRDFFAIMSVLGLKKEAQACWNLAAEIDKAHMQAGRLVRRQLLRQVLKSDLNVLEQRGEMRFELAEIGGKPLLALRVVEVSDQAVQISNSHLNKLFELE